MAPVYIKHLGLVLPAIHNRVLGTGLTLPLAVMRKSNEMPEPSVFKHWARGSIRKGSLRKL